MKATYDKSRATKWSNSHRKEGNCQFTGYRIMSVEPEKNSQHRLMTRVDLRIYHTKSTAFACLWIRGCDMDSQGSGRAGGYGYHRGSAAVDEAIRNTGFTLDQSIGGVGDNAIREALHAIAECLGITDYGLVEIHP